jgi:outer membrane receptor protein involved in Fe transport
MPAYRITDRLQVSAQWRLAGQSLEPLFGMPPATLPAYSLIGIYGEYALRAKGKLFVDIQNLTNEFYYDQLGFTARPRAINFGFQWNF